MLLLEGGCLGDGCRSDALSVGMTILTSGRCWSVIGDDRCCCCCCCCCGRNDRLIPRECLPTDTEKPPPDKLSVPTTSEGFCEGDSDDSAGSTLEARRRYMAKCRLMSDVVVSGCCCCCGCCCCRCMGITRSCMGSSRALACTWRLARSSDAASKSVVKHGINTHTY